MAKQRVYIETTVPSAYFDSRTPERQAMTVQFWNQGPESYDFCISTLVQFEIEDTRDSARKEELQSLVAGLPLLEADEE